MNSIEYQAVINNNTGVIHYVSSRHILEKIPYPLCGNLLNNYPEGRYAHYSFTLEPATCKRCTSPNAETWFLEQIRPRLGWWFEQLSGATMIARTHLCPFQLFAKKHGYDLKHDRLIFPNTALEFNRHLSEWRQKPGAGLNLPSHVHIDHAGTRERTYHDKVMLVKFMEYSVDGLMVPWELIIETWPEGSHSNISFETITVRGDTIKGG